MVCSISVDKSEEKLKINSDSYDLNRISDVQVKELTWKDKLTNMLLFGLITSSILFYFLITHDPQPASRADMASEGLPRLHAPIQPTCS